MFAVRDRLHHKVYMCVVGDVLSQIPVLDVGIPAILSVYFDWFSGVMQAFIFCMLTVMYIANAAEE